MYLFFFSSRRRHTRWPRDWSSDVCSSDLFLQQIVRRADNQLQVLSLGGALLFSIRIGVESALIEDPLRGGVQKRQKRVRHHLPVKPQMHAGDWRDIDFVQICERRITLLDALWEQFPQRGVGHGEYV